LYSCSSYFICGEKTPGFLTCTKASLYLVMRRKISTPLGNDILGAHLVAEPILYKGDSGDHVDRMAKYKIMIKKDCKQSQLARSRFIHICYNM